MQEAGALTIHPWALATSNQRSHADQLRAVRIPDVPATALAAAGGGRGSLGMMTGDFVAVCGERDQEGQWDAVATCFFIDTAHNVAEYLEVPFWTAQTIRFEGSLLVCLFAKCSQV